MKNGDIVKDTISGFTGVVVAEHRYLNGCVRLSLQPKEMKDGKPIDSHTFDIEQLELVEQSPPRTVTPSGGPHDEPKRAAIPSR